MIRPVNALAPKVFFKGQTGYENPVNRRTERNLAILNAGGVSAAIGALTTMVARSYASSWRHAGYFGLSAAAISMMFVCPGLLYKSGIKSFAKEQEMDVFSREKEVQKKLLTDVNSAIEKHSDELQTKIQAYSITKQSKKV